MHDVVFDLICLDGFESAESDMKRHIQDLDPLGLDLFQQFISKVKTGCRAGGRTVDLRIDVVVAGIVLQLFVNVRRGRHHADFIEDF